MPATGALIGTPASIIASEPPQTDAIDELPVGRFLHALADNEVPLIAAALVAGWLLALGLRRIRGESLRGAFLFNLGQLALVVWTLVALGILFWGVQIGLLGTPDMQIAGNGSSAYQLNWYTDRTGPLLPGAWILSVPLLLYRLAMLAWALWLALAMLRWLRWGWDCLNTGDGWREIGRVDWQPESLTVPPAVPAPSVAEEPKAADEPEGSDGTSG